MKSKVLIAVAFGLMVAVSGCTEQDRARNFGGSATTDLAECRKLEMIDWKEDNLWILTRAMRADDTAESYEFRQDAS